MREERRWFSGQIFLALVRFPGWSLVDLNEIMCTYRRLKRQKQSRIVLINYVYIPLRSWLNVCFDLNKNAILDTIFDFKSPSLLLHLFMNFSYKFIFLYFKNQIIFLCFLSSWFLFFPHRHAFNNTNMAQLIPN
jgi:hypothetical protein